MFEVSVVKALDYDEAGIQSGLARSLEAIDFEIPRNITVLIKPNCLAQNKPGQHTVTHFSLVDGVASLLRDNGCRILIGESSAFFQAGLTRRAFDTTLMKHVADKYGARLVPFEEEKLVKVDLHEYMVLPDDFPVRELFIPKIVLETDLLINACKLKSHGSGFRLSGAIKNLYGLLPGGSKQIIHLLLKDDSDACDIMVALHKIARPGLSIMDAVVGLDGGPSAIGKPVSVGAILASANAAALDSIACGIIGYEPSEVPLLVRAKASGLIGDWGDVIVKGDPLPSVSFKRLPRGPFPARRKKDSVFIKDTFVYPFIRERSCGDCGKCIDFCPLGAISRKGARQYMVNYSKCIHCYYCFAACPEQAIGYKGTMIGQAIRFFWKVLGL